MRNVSRRFPALLRHDGHRRAPPIRAGWRGRGYDAAGALERDEKGHPLVVTEELTRADIPESITLCRDEAFDVLEGLEAGAERGWGNGDLDRAVTYDRLAAVIRRALGAEE